MSEEISVFEAAVLGLVQGLTEFIPVSSSAHLNITHQTFGHGRELTFDLLLHVGTLTALAFYFRRDWVQLLTNREQSKLRNLVFLGCVPAAILGVFLRDAEERPPLSDPRFNAVMLVVAGLVLWGADRTGQKERVVDDVNVKDALWVGAAQAIALIPGVSRSGATMTAGLFLGMTRDAAARFSFLMSLPITAGAVGFDFYKTFVKDKASLDAFGATPLAMATGVGVSAVSGFLAISFLLNYLRRHGVGPFVVWRVLVAVLVWLFLKPAPPKPDAETPRAALFAPKR